MNENEIVSNRKYFEVMDESEVEYIVGDGEDLESKILQLRQVASLLLSRAMGLQEMLQIGRAHV